MQKKLTNNKRMNFVNLTHFTFNSLVSEKLTNELVFSDTQLFTYLYYLTRDLFWKGGDGWGVDPPAWRGRLAVSVV